ncbi:hypothetical protein EJ06DRAFT_523524 [Trichodelitschia bisporula]|uniref:Uncharacterized protein n=1 Tax=Trichodelitschia bisporula TaxID=703511 RepID=A0A6G1HQK1_9PEZI|nr:hypothetical protein EJ06DRAFT_523524 [Trichodelitschia bisporula]
MDVQFKTADASKAVIDVINQRGLVRAILNRKGGSKFAVYTATGERSQHRPLRCSKNRKRRPSLPDCAALQVWMVPYTAMCEKLREIKLITRRIEILHLRAYAERRDRPRRKTSSTNPAGSHFMEQIQASITEALAGQARFETMHKESVGTIDALRKEVVELRDSDEDLSRRLGRVEEKHTLMIKSLLEEWSAPGSASDVRGPSLVMRRNQQDIARWGSSRHQAGFERVYGVELGAASLIVDTIPDLLLVIDVAAHTKLLYRWEGSAKVQVIQTGAAGIVKEYLATEPGQRANLFRPGGEIGSEGP